MSLDVPKVFRRPGCDHGHDEEYRNGRDVKIYILDDYFRTPEWFRKVSDIYRSTRGLPKPSRGFYWASWALVEKRRGGQGQPRTPFPPSPNWTRRGGAPPFLSPSLSFPLLSYSYLEGGSPTPGGSRTPHGARHRRPPPPPPPLLYIRGGGHPLETQQLIS